MLDKVSQIKELKDVCVTSQNITKNIKISWIVLLLFKHNLFIDLKVILFACIDSYIKSRFVYLFD